MTALLAQARPELVLPLVLLPASWAFMGLYLTLRHQDRLLARLFAGRRDLWKALGGPRGWRWTPPRRESSPVLYASLHFDWLCASEPTWLQDAPEFLADYRAVRAGVRRWNFVAMPVFIGAGLLAFLLIKLTG